MLVIVATVAWCVVGVIGIIVMLAGRTVKHEGIGMLTYFCGGLLIVFALGGLLRVGAMT